MSIANKLTTIAENEQKVYNAGHSKGFVEGHNIGYDDGIEQGRQAVYDEFWDEYQQNGNRRNYANAFEGAFWTQERYSRHKYSIGNAQGCNYMFRYSNVADLSDLNIQGCQGAYMMCESAYNLVEFGSLNLTWASCERTFYNCPNLVSVGTITTVAARAYGDTFYNCSKLQEITFSGVIGQNLDMRYSPLNRASIESIISCLSDTATGKTLTLKKTAKEAAFTEDEWVTLITPKSNQYDGNWTISLV